MQQARCAAHICCIASPCFPLQSFPAYSLFLFKLPWLQPAPDRSLAFPCPPQVVCEVYATQPSLQCAPHVLFSLILYKMVDPAREVGALGSERCMEAVPHIQIRQCSSVGTLIL